MNPWHSAVARDQNKWFQELKSKQNVKREPKTKSVQASPRHCNSCFL